MEQRVQTVALVVLATVSVGAALYWLRPVMIPFVLAVFITLGLQPVIDLQMRHLWLPRPVAVFTTFLLGILGLFLLGSMVSSTVAQISEQAPTYATQLNKTVERALALLPDQVGDVSVEDELRAWVAAPLRSAGSIIMGTTNAIVDVLSRLFLVMLFVAFLLAGSRGRRAEGTWGEVERSIQSFLATKTTISAATGLLVWLVLELLGVPLAQVFGLMAFLLNFVPSIGSIIATLLPLPVVLVSPEVTPAAAVLALVVPGAIQLLIGNVLEPRIMGASLDLHPAAVLLSLILWGALWGVLGMLLATPITAMMRILLARFPGTRGLADLLSGRLDTWRSPEAKRREAA